MADVRRFLSGIRPMDVLGFVVAQIAGALLATAVIRWLWKKA